MSITLPLNYNEEDFIDACIRNERWAQQLIYEEYYGSMKSVCMRYSNNSDEAVDIMHEGFIKVFKNIRKYKAGTSLSSWIHRIMVNTSIDYYRKRKRRRTEDIDVVRGNFDLAPDAVQMCSEKDILKSIQTLSPSYRNVFNLYIIEGYSHKEVSKQLGITESTSRSNLVKARNKLKEILSKRM